jgi:hypothetical protein
LSMVHVKLLKNWRMPSSGMLLHVALVFLRSMFRLLVTADVPSSAILITLMREAICSFKMSVITRATQCNVPEDGILQSRHCQNLKPYTVNKLFSAFRCAYSIIMVTLRKMNSVNNCVL